MLFLVALSLAPVAAHAQQGADAGSAVSSWQTFQQPADGYAFDAIGQSFQLLDS
jgi:hypothetical protein